MKTKQQIKQQLKAEILKRYNSRALESVKGVELTPEDFLEYIYDENTSFEDIEYLYKTANLEIQVIDELLSLVNYQNELVKNLLDTNNRINKALDPLLNAKPVFDNLKDMLASIQEEISDVGSNLSEELINTKDAIRGRRGFTALMSRQLGNDLDAASDNLEDEESIEKSYKKIAKSQKRDWKNYYD